MTAKMRSVVFCRWVAIALAALLFDAGYARAQSSPPPANTAAAAIADEDEWSVCTIKGVRVGYQETTIHHATKDGRQVVVERQITHAAVKRFGQTTTMDMELSSTETPAGRLLDFQSEVRQGPAPLRTSGQVRGDRLEIQTTTSGKTISSSIPWPADEGGFFAVEQSLLRRPMKAGEQRTIHCLMGLANQVVQVDLTARNKEQVKLPAGKFDLLRIDSVTRLPGGGTMTGTLWTDGGGVVLKDREPMDLEAFRVPKEVALSETAPPTFDLSKDELVKLSRPLSGAHQTRRVRYRVELEGGDPATVFVSGPSQEVKSTGPHTAEITVWAIRPGRKDGNPKAAADPPTAAARQPNNFIQSDDPKIVADAKEAAGTETDPWKVAVALERYVHRVLQTTFNDAFSTAADVARARKGDCKEHAIYLAALARARGIPARVAIGLVYLNGAFGGHMWTEVYIDGRWIPLDATLGDGGIGAAHLKQGQSALEGVSAYLACLPAAQVVGRLKIEVLEAE
ncbi:MAG: transglutaminase-like domain-containing protein [Thermoguttaceae bacterium]